MMATTLTDIDDRVEAILAGMSLRDTAWIAAFGTPAESGARLADAASLVEGLPSQELSQVLERAVAQLAEADPSRLARKPGRISAFFGKALQTELEYKVARADVEKLLIDAAEIAERIRASIKTIEAEIAAASEENAALSAHIDAAEIFLTRIHPDAAPVEETFGASPRERLERRLANLRRLKAANEMNIPQLQFARAASEALYERYYDIRHVLVPVWRQHMLAIANNRNIDPRQLQAATEAHNNLVDGLTRSLHSTITRSGRPT